MAPLTKDGLIVPTHLLPDLVCGNGHITPASGGTIGVVITWPKGDPRPVEKHCSVCWMELLAELLNSYGARLQPIPVIEEPTDGQ